MNGYVSVLGVKWPTPGVFGITLTLVLLFSALAIFIIYKYFETKEQTRIHNYQHFLFLAKRRGLNNFQFKILKNMAFNLKLSNPKDLVSNHVLFESILVDFIDYLKKQSEGEDSMAGIFRDLVMIYEKLYLSGPQRKPLESMSDIEDGEMIWFLADNGETCLGKVAGRGGDFIELKLFISEKNMISLEGERGVSLHLIRVNDAEYRIDTVTAGLDLNMLRVKFSDNIVKEREFRHPYVNVVLPAVVTIESAAGEDPLKIECTILQANEFECVARIESPLEYGREYSLGFEINRFRFNLESRVISSKSVETDRVYYYTFRFPELKEPGRGILSRFISESL